MTVRGIDAKKIAKDWLRLSVEPGKNYFWRSMKSHKAEMKKGGEYSGIHAETYKLMCKHPWGQEYLKIDPSE